MTAQGRATGERKIILLTPAQLKQLQLEKQENGFYSTEEVDGLLSQLTKDYSDVFAENGNLIRKLSVLASKLDEYRKDENVLRDVLLNAQKSADLIISAAQSQADEMLVDANKNVADVLRRGDGIIADANAKADKINAAAEAEYTSIISSAKVMADGYLAAARESAASVTSEVERSVNALMGDCDEKAKTMLEEAQNNAADIVRRAKEAAEKAVAEARVEADEIKDESIARAAELKEQSEAKAEQLENYAKEISAEAIENANEKAKEIVDEANAKADELNNGAKLNSTAMLNEAKTQAEEFTRAATEQAEELTRAANEQVEAFTKAAQDEAEKLAADTKAQAEEILAAANYQAGETLSAAKAQAEETLAEAKAQADSLLEEARASVDTMYAEAKERAEQYVTNAQAQARVLTDAALEKAGELEKASEEEAKGLLEDARKQADETVAAAMSQAQELAASAEDYATGLMNSARENSDTLYYKLNSRSSVLLVEAERNAAILKQAVEEYAESKRTEGEEQFTRLIGDAEEKSAAMLNNAKTTSDAMMAEAKEKADALLLAAREKAEELTKVSETNSFLFIENAKQQAAGDSEEIVKEAVALYEETRQYAEKINAEATGVRANALRSAESLLTAAKSRAEEIISAAQNAVGDAELEAAKQANDAIDVPGVIAGADTFDVSQAAVALDDGIDFSSLNDTSEAPAGPTDPLSSAVLAKSDEDLAAAETAAQESLQSLDALYEAGLADLDVKRGELNEIRETAREGLAALGEKAEEALESVRKTKTEIEKLNTEEAPVYVARMELDDAIDSIQKKYSDAGAEKAEAPVRLTDRVDMTLPEVALPDIKEPVPAPADETSAEGLVGGVVPEIAVKGIAVPKISAPEISRPVPAVEDDFDLDSIDISAEVAAQEALLEEQNRAMSAASIIDGDMELDESDFDSFDALEDFDYEDLLAAEQPVETSSALQYIGRFETDDGLEYDEDGDPIVPKNEAVINEYVASVKDAINEQYADDETAEEAPSPAYEAPVRILEEEDDGSVAFTEAEPDLTEAEVTQSAFEDEAEETQAADPFAGDDFDELLAASDESDDFDDFSEGFAAFGDPLKATAEAAAPAEEADVDELPEVSEPTGEIVLKEETGDVSFSAEPAPDPQAADAAGEEDAAAEPESRETYRSRSEQEADDLAKSIADSIEQLDEAAEQHAENRQWAIEQEHARLEARKAAQPDPVAPGKKHRKKKRRK